MRTSTTPPHFATLVLLTAFSVLSLNMFIPSLADIAADFGVSYSIVSISVAGYLAVTAVLQLVVGPLSDRLGRRRVLLPAVTIFTLASLGCVLSGSVWSFLVFRMFQAAIISGYVLSLAIVRDVMPPKQAAGRIGYIAMAMAVAPMLGPMLGGLLDTAFGWRANFVAYAGAGMALFLLCWLDLGETLAPRPGGSKARLPIFRELATSRRFWGYALCMAFSTGAFYAFLAGAPLVAKSRFGMSAATLGVCIGSITCGYMAGAFISGRLAPRHALTTMMIAGRFVACSGLMVGLTLLLFRIVSVPTYFGSTILVGLGNGISTPSSSAGAISVRPELAGSAAGLAGAITVAGGAVLTSFTGVILGFGHASAVLLAIMLVASAAGLLCALWVRRLDLAGPDARLEGTGC